MRIRFHILFSLFVFAINVCDAQQVVRAGEMVVPRTFHTTTLLKDGRVLAIGGFAGDGGGTKFAEVYDPTNGTWRRVGDMVAQRYLALAVRLHDGRVLIASGSSLELFDPTTETFSTAGSVPGYINAALLLPDGRVFLADERGKNPALYDPVAGVTATLDTMEEGAPIVLPDGRLVVIGSSSAWIYELKETSLKLLIRHDLGGTIYQRSAALLRDGNILIAGGSLNPFNGPPSSKAVLYDPLRGTVRSTGS
ncbi:MAG TPA: kelch repeat-containing protein, partial [Bryobacteraceae bacterium]|nr:kelch repeat-containing protein [Bryobacteraceae bacterium]